MPNFYKLFPNRGHLHIGGALHDAADLVDVGDVEHGVHALAEQVEGQGDIVFVAVLVLVTLTAVVSAAVAGQLLGSRAFFSPPPWRRLAGLLMWWEFIAAAAMALTMAARSALLPTTGLILCTTLVSPGNVLLN